MKRALIRSQIFNLAFYAYNIFACVLLLPALIAPRPFLLKAIRLYLRGIHFLEVTLLGLRFEVRGREHLPKEGPFLIAAKHQSPYETLKLHLLLDDPAIVLKRELLQIPVWGKYLRKADMIAIDRSARGQAIEMLVKGAKRVKQQGRPLLIFPQGTRVDPDHTTQERPYKQGIVHIQKATGLPVIPLAMNSGLFWPRKGWLKSSGTVVFEFLPPIPPHIQGEDLRQTLENLMERHSNTLAHEAREKNQQKAKVSPQKLILAGLLLLLLFMGSYTLLWFEAAKRIRQNHIAFMDSLRVVQAEITPPVISGFPGPLEIYIREQSFADRTGRLTIRDLQITSWPALGLPINVQSGPVSLEYFRWPSPLTFENLEGKLYFWGRRLNVDRMTLKQNGFRTEVTGYIDFPANSTVPVFSLEAALENHPEFLRNLNRQGILDKRMAMFLTAAMLSLTDEAGILRAPIHQKNEKLFIGPLPVADLTFFQGPIVKLTSDPVRP